MAMLVLVAGAVVGVSAFFDSARNLLGLAREAAVRHAAGTWVTPVLTDPYDATIHYHLVFELRENGQSLGGSLTYFDESRHDGGARQPILDGKIDHGEVSFRSPWINADDQKTHSDFYRGKISGGDLELETWNDADGGGDIQKFKATRRPD